MDSGRLIPYGSIELIPDNIKHFLDQRIALVRENRYPIQISIEAPSRYVMHIIPHHFDKIHLDVKQLVKPENYFFPHGEAENQHIVPDFNFDGVVFNSGMHEKYGYTQVFRDAKIETVIGAGKYDASSGNNYLSLFRIRNNTEFRLRLYFQILKRFSITGPFTIFFRMIGMEGVKLRPEDIKKVGDLSSRYTKSIAREELIFPSMQLDSEADIDNFIKKTFDICWNMFGFEEMKEAKEKAE